MVLADCQGHLTKCAGVTCDGMTSHPRGEGGGVVIPLVAASCYGDGDKLRLNGLLGLSANLTLYLFKRVASGVHVNPLPPL